MQSNSCPFLGLHSDSESYIAYASYNNCCQHTRRKSHIRLDYQEKYCLTGGHTNCSVFLAKEISHLPAQAAGLDRMKRYRLVRWGSMLLVAVFIVLIAGLGWFFLGDKLPGFASVSPEMVVQPSYMAPTYLYAQPTIDDYVPGIISASPDQKQTGSTTENDGTGSGPSAFTETLTASPKLAYHQVIEGDNLDALARKYNTTVEAILGINYSMRVPLWVDEIIVIPQDITNIGRLPKFELKKVQQKTTVAAITNMNECSTELFVEYNFRQIISDDGTDYILADTWVFIPRVVPTTQP